MERHSQLVYFFFCTLFVSTAFSYAIRPKVDETDEDYGRPLNDLADIYEQELNHDLQWNDAVDGSYDLSNEDQLTSQQRIEAHPKSRIITNFRIIPNIEAWSANTKVPLSSKTNSLRNQQKPHSIDGPRNTEQAEVEILLGQDDVTPAGFVNERKIQVETVTDSESDDEEEEKETTSENPDDSEDDYGTSTTLSEEEEPEEDEEEETTTFEPMTKIPERTVSSTRPTTTTRTVTRPVAATGGHKPILSSPRLRTPPEVRIVGPVFKLNTAREIEKRRPQVEAVKLIEPETSPHHSITLPIVFGCLGAVALASVIAILLHQRARKRKASFDEECMGYGNYGVTGPMTTKPLVLERLTQDRLLAQSTENYHYQQQKRLILSSSSSGSASVVNEPRRSVDHSDYNTENEEEAEGDEYGDYTVYECPGLAPPGDFEVINPLFADQSDNSVEIISSED